MSDALPDTTERLLVAVRSLPESLQAEVLVFAEFLRARKARDPAQAVPLTDLCGGLSDSATFTGDPVAVQEALRDEWR